ncbi:DUF6382 domain-containing protein [Anaerovorax odorimutans]|uniref:DUF6382 domain-containing protein n=1 Tax=Anaerovorax odorimutans TaxID=109327 RepID=UPI0004030C5E|nr:DUF6382 domain-containing protein [Anaerovorax odorimutans]
MRDFEDEIKEDFKLQSYEVKIEDLYGRRKLVMEIDSAKFYNFERKYLESNLCHYMLPMNFINIDSKEKIYYDITRLIPIESYIRSIKNEKKERFPQEENTRIAFSIIEQILSAVKDAEDCLLFLNRYRICKDNIFANIQTGNIHIAYLPEENDLPTQTKIIEFIDSINKLFNEEIVSNTLFNLTQNIKRENLGIDEISNEISRIKREFVITYADSLR